MTSSRSVTKRWLVMMCLLVVVGVVWSLENKPQSGRDLTPREMARLFGRQPDPPPINAGECQWCAYLQTVNQCTGNNPCPTCVTVAQGCENYEYWEFSGNNIGWRVSAGLPYHSFWAIPVANPGAFCNGKYLCVTAPLNSFQLCPPTANSGCGTNTVDTKCAKCLKGPLVWPTPKDDDYCDWEACLF